MTTKFSVPDMHCDHCVAAIRTAANSVEGVSSVDVNLATKTVTFDSASDAAVASVKAAIEDAGFDVAE